MHGVQRFIQWAESQPDFLAESSPGATDEALDAAEQAIARPLPPSPHTLYRWRIDALSFDDSFDQVAGYAERGLLRSHGLETQPAHRSLYRVRYGQETPG